MEISGLELVKGLEAGLAYYGINRDCFLQVGGMELAFDPTKNVGERVDLASVRIDGAPLDPARSYTMTASSEIVMLLPLMGVQMQNVVIRNDLEVEVLRDHVTELGEIRSRPEGRILEIR